MKLQSVTSAIAVAAIALDTTTILNQPTYAQETTDDVFFCDQTGAKPKTMMHTPWGDAPVIEWSSSKFNQWGFNSDKRCKEVSKRFQEAYKCGLLEPEHITSGAIPATEGKKRVFYPAVMFSSNAEVSKCTELAKRVNGPNALGLLFMLPPQTDARIVTAQLRCTLEQFNHIRYTGSAEPISDTPSSSLSDMRCTVSS